jgi:hypothetical protein
VERDVKTSGDRESGLVAVLDALGASNYSDAEIQRFMRSRQNVLELLNQKAEEVLGNIKAGMITTFTFNDTILIVLRTGSSGPTLTEITSFFLVLRKFFVDSLAHRILFRGSIAAGTFYANDDTNTVMGQAVTDAAAWYDKADWIGIHATPRTSLYIQRWLERGGETKAHIMLDYDVPLKTGGSVKAKALNWPTAFFVQRTSPCGPGEQPREKLLECLTANEVPSGTERKFFNALAFFDFAVKKIHREVKRTDGPSGRRSASAARK